MVTSFVQPFVLRASGFNGPGPSVSGSFINIDFGNATGPTLYPTLFGSSMAADVDYTPWADTTLQATAKNNAGFGLPGMYARINGENNIFTSTGPNFTFIDRISTSIPNIIDTSTGVWSLTLGLGTTDPTTFATYTTQTHNRFIANGVVPHMYEVLNEPDSTSDATYDALFVAAADALHALDSSIIVSGTCDSFIHPAPRFTDLANAVGSSRAATTVFCYHSYSVNSSVSDANIFTQGMTRFQNDAQRAIDTLAGTPCTGSFRSIGEYNMDGAPPGDGRQQQVIGAVWHILMLMTAFSTDPLHRYGALWDWFGDGFYGQISTDKVTLFPTAYCLKTCRQYMGGAVVSSANPGAGSLVRVLSSTIGGNFGVLLVNFSPNTTTAGQIALSRWPVNQTGTAAIQRLEVSPANPNLFATSLQVTAGLTASLQLPGYSVTILTP